jgi:hypothetical protein
MDSLIQKRRFEWFRKVRNFVTTRLEAIYKVKLLRTFVKSRFRPKGEASLKEFLITRR